MSEDRERQVGHDHDSEAGDGDASDAEPALDAGPGYEVVDLRTVLVDLGVADEVVDQAIADGTLELLALEKVASLEEARFTLAEVATLSGVAPDRIRAYWRALGFPDPRPDDRVFTDSDVEMLSAVVSFIAEGTLDPELAIQMARVIGSAMDKIANAQVDALEVRRPEREVGDAPPFIGASRSTADLLSLMPKVMEFVWRRQLASAARRRMVRVAEDAGTGVVVGFADLVGFTAKTQQLTEQELAEVVTRFETVAYDVVAEHGGRIVKTIGDAVMFVDEDTTDGALLALDLAERFRNDPNLSDVRVGLACGPVLERDGDVYGHTVNLANRIVSVAYPGTVVVSKELHDAIADDEGFVLRSLRSHYLKDIGRVPLWTLRRAEDRSEKPYRRARRRRSNREFLRERWTEIAEQATQLSGELPVDLPAELLDDDGAPAGEPTTGQIEAISEAVLESDLDPDIQVNLLGDLEAARRLKHLEREAQDKAAEADEEAEKRLEQIEREARKRVEEAEREARRKIEAALAEAEERSRKINEEASRKVKRVAEEVERKADKVEREAKVDAEKKARRRSRDRKKS